MIATDVLTTIREEMILVKAALLLVCLAHCQADWTLTVGACGILILVLIKDTVTDSMSQHLNQGRVTSKLLMKYVKML